MNDSQEKGNSTTSTLQDLTPYGTTCLSKKNSAAKLTEKKKVGFFFLLL